MKKNIVIAVFLSCCITLLSYIPGLSENYHVFILDAYIQPFFIPGMSLYGLWGLTVGVELGEFVIQRTIFISLCINAFFATLFVFVNSIHPKTSLDISSFKKRKKLLVVGWPLTVPVIADLLYMPLETLVVSEYLGCGCTTGSANMVNELFRIMIFFTSVCLLSWNMKRVNVNVKSKPLCFTIGLLLLPLISHYLCRHVYM